MWAGKKTTAGAIPTLVLLACQPQVDQAIAEPVADTVPVQLVFRDSQCRSDDPKIDLIADSQALRQWWRPLGARSLPATAVPTVLDEIDLEKNILLIISMGTRPTSGYGIRLAEDVATVEGMSLSVRTVWQSPEAGLLVAQVLTSPCTAIRVPAAPYKQVRIMDQNGELVLEQTGN